MPLEEPQTESAFFSQEPHVLPSVPVVGAFSGRVWQFLNSKGTTSVIKLKSELKCTATVLHLSLGWLLREDKIEFREDKGQLAVRLK